MLSNKAMRLLLIDNSNTRTKFSVVAAGQQGYDIRHVASRDLDAPFITELNALDFEAVAISSVGLRFASSARRTRRAPQNQHISNKQIMLFATKLAI